MNKFYSRFYESRLSPNLKSKSKNLKSAGVSSVINLRVRGWGCLAPSAAADESAPDRIPNWSLAFLFHGAHQAFLQGLRDLGYAKQIRVNHFSMF